MPDGLPPTTERLENVNFRQFLLRLGNLGFIHIFEGWQNPSDSDGAYLSLSVLKITMSGNNQFASVNQRSPHCLKEWWPGGTGESKCWPQSVQEINQNSAIVWFIFPVQWVHFKTKSNAREIWRSWSRNSFSQYSLIMRCQGTGGLVWWWEQMLV